MGCEGSGSHYEPLSIFTQSALPSFDEFLAAYAHAGKRVGDSASATKACVIRCDDGFAVTQGMTDQIKRGPEGPARFFSSFRDPLDSGLATSRTLEVGDLEPVAGLQAAAKPVGSVAKLAQEHLRLDAILVGCMSDGVAARWRERSIVQTAARLAASNPGLVAVPEA